MITPSIARTDPTFIAAARGEEPCDRVFTGGLVLDVFRRSFVEADVGVFRGRIAAVVPRRDGSIDARERTDCAGLHLAPGFIDAHMHVESSMLPPTRFAALAAPHGTTAAVFDPHEIANVLGVAGLRWLAKDAERAAMHALLALSSCVPSSPLETAGATIDVDTLRSLFADPELAPHVVALAEMMNFPGVINAERDVLAKVELGLRERIVDGHAPGLSGRPLQAYAAAGITSDHECTTAAEAEEKLAAGIRIAIREGSAARNLDALVGLVNEGNAHRFLFCTDDRHPDDLREHGHIDHIARRAIVAGIRPETALTIASLHAAEHYRRPDLGAIAPGRVADLVLLDDPVAVGVQQTWHAGILVAQRGVATIEPPPLDAWPDAGVTLPTDFGPGRLRIPAPPAGASVRVIGMHPDSLVTDELAETPTVADGSVVADPERDLLKFAVVERHHGTGRVGLGLVRNFRFRGGAIASTVGHDAHNLAIVGDDDSAMVIAAQHLSRLGGGQCVVSDGNVTASLPLPIAGLMSDRDPDAVIQQQHALLAAAHERLGCPHADPFMPLSFLSLPVIPYLKLTDLGLVDVGAFRIVPVAL